MLVTLPLLLISLALATIAGDYARRRKPARDIDPCTAEGPSAPTEVLARIGRVGHPLGSPSRLGVAVSPPASPDTALELFARSGEKFRRVQRAQLVMVRGWSAGHLVVAHGKARYGYGPSWPLGVNLAGWELHLVTTSGEVIRCYGAPGTTLDAELVVLRDQLRSSRAAHAS